MRIARLLDGHVPHFARLIDADHAQLWTGAPWAGGMPTPRVVALSTTNLLRPVEPSKIVGVGRNYAAHARELGHDVPAEPLLFLKPPSALCDPEAPICLPAMVGQVDHEAEIGVVIGRRIRRAGVTEARSAIFGATCVNDVTARDLQRRDVQFTRAKGFDTFCPVGPWIETELDLDDLAVTATVDGCLRQQGHTRNMVFSIAQLVAFISHAMTLEAGDLIATGTPRGVGPLLAGQTVEIEVEGIGTLRNPVQGP